MVEQDSVFDIAIVGAGFCGSMVAVHLAQLAPTLRVLIADTENAIGRGIAYGTQDFRHLLNVPAGRMSAFPDAPDHFVEWLDLRGPVFRNLGLEPLLAEDYVPRRIFGAYIRELFNKARESAPGFHVVASYVRDIEPRGDLLRLTLETGEVLLAGKVVLALGNFPPADPSLRDEDFHKHPRYLSDPWSPETLRLISRNDDILILGSGLTALDLIVSLSGVKARGIIHVISRHGLFPQPHRHYQPQPSRFNGREFPLSMRGLVRLIRSEVRAAAASGIDWRAVVDALRPHSQKIWQSLSIPERKRFMRHVRPFWESHRHRAPFPLLAERDSLINRRQLALHRGHIIRIGDARPGLSVTFFNRATHCKQTLRVAYAVNCTGPECNYQKLKSPLIVNLLARGLIHPDPLLLGLNAAPDGAVLDSDGLPSSRIFTLGSAAKGMLYETTAVPELRLQAKALAGRLLLDHGTL